MTEPHPATPRSHPQDAGVDRPLGPALRHGWALRCPACGEGRMLSGYLKVRDACPACGEDLHHQRADDGPSYLTILLVGHLLAPLMLWSYTVFRPEPWVLTSAFVGASVLLSVWLLPRMKGLMVAFQWARRMHGFGEPAAERQG